MINAELEKYKSSKSVRINDLLNSLSRKEVFIKALETEIGRAILDDLICEMARLLDKIVDETASEVERADFRVGRRLIEKWVDKINSYMVEKVSLDKLVVKEK